MGLANMIRRRRRRPTTRVRKDIVVVANGAWFTTSTDDVHTVHLGKDPVAERCPFDHDGDGTCPWHDQSCQQPDPKADKYLSSWSFQLGDPAPTEGPRFDDVTPEPAPPEPTYSVGVDVARETGEATVVVVRHHDDGRAEVVPAMVVQERGDGAVRERMREVLEDAWSRQVDTPLPGLRRTAHTITVRNPVSGTERTIILKGRADGMTTVARRAGSAEDPSDRTTTAPTKHDLLVRIVQHEHEGRQLRMEAQQARDRAVLAYDAQIDKLDGLLGDLAREKLALGVPTCPVHETGCPNGGRDCWKVDDLVAEYDRTHEYPTTPEDALVRTETWDAGKPFEENPTVTVVKAPPIDEQIHLGSPLDSVKGALAGVRMGTDHRREIDAFLDTITAPSARLEYHDVEGDIVNGEFLRREPVSDGHLDEQVAAKLEPVTVPSDEPDAF